MSYKITCFVLGFAALSSALAQADSLKAYRCTGIKNPDIEFDMGAHDTHASIKAGRDICMPLVNPTFAPSAKLAGYARYDLRAPGYRDDQVERESYHCKNFVHTATGKPDLFVSF